MWAFQLIAYSFRTWLVFRSAISFVSLHTPIVYNWSGNSNFYIYYMISGNPLQYSCLENPMDRGAWQATVHGGAKSRARLSGEHTHTVYYPNWEAFVPANVKQWGCQENGEKLTYPAKPELVFQFHTTHANNLINDITFLFFFFILL